jgi:hypothetical protein
MGSQKMRIIARKEAILIHDIGSVIGEFDNSLNIESSKIVSY